MYEVVLSDSNSDLEFEFENHECHQMMTFLAMALPHRLNDDCIATIIYVEEREDTCLDNLKSDT